MHTVIISLMVFLGIWSWVGIYLLEAAYRKRSMHLPTVESELGRIGDLLYFGVLLLAWPIFLRRIRRVPLPK